MAENILLYDRGRDPRMREIIDKSSKQWLDYDDIRTLFKSSGKFPVSNGPASFEEGIYFYKKEQEVDKIVWDFQSQERTVLPGEIIVSYTSASTSFSNYHNSSPTLVLCLVRRVYHCEGEEVLCLVHFRKVEEEKKEVEEGQKAKAELEEDVTPPPVATDLVAVYGGDPLIEDILQDSTNNWLDYGDLMTLFALSGKLPLSKGLAAGIDKLDKGIYVFNRQENLQTVDWYGYVTTVPGVVPVSYRSAYAVPYDPSLNATMVRRVYECDEYGRFIVHCRLIVEGQEDDEEEDEEEDEEAEGEVQEEEDGEAEGEGQEEEGEAEGEEEWEEAGEDVPPVDLAAPVASAAFAMDLGDDYDRSDVAPVP